MDEGGYVCKGMKRRLCEAAKSGNLQVLNEIGELRGVANEATPGGNTVLHISAFHGSLQFLQKLIDFATANPEDGIAFLKAKNKLGNTALHEAALGGNGQVVKALLHKCPDLVIEINKEGETALFKACEGGYPMIVEELCPLTPTEYNKRFDGQTPLHLAVYRLSIGIIKVLLDKKPELAIEVDVFGRTPLHMAALFPAEFITWPLFPVFLYRIFPTSPLFPVFLYRIFQKSSLKIWIIGEMLMKKDELSCYRVDQNGQSALHIAAKEGNAPLVKVILKNNSDCLEIVDNNGRNALHLAVENAPRIFEKVRLCLEYIICLVMSKRLINCVDKNGQTALDIALQKEDEDRQLYISLKFYLQGCGAVRKISDMGSATVSPTRPKKTKWKAEFVSLSAALIATIAFTVAFTVPGGIDSQGTPILISTHLFKVFVIGDTMAFCFSMASTFLCNLAIFASKVEDPIITGACFSALWVALASLSLTFGAAIHMVVASKSLWLAMLVWAMVGILPICIRITSLQGKLYLFTRPENHILVLLRNSIVIASVVVSPIIQVVGVAFSGIILRSFCWLRKRLTTIRK